LFISIFVIYGFACILYFSLIKSFLSADISSLKSTFNKYENDTVVKVSVTAIESYGAFANIDEEYDGLIHISEISYRFVRNIKDFVKIGEEIYAKIVDVDEENKKVKLSIKDIDYQNDGSVLKRMEETKRGFEPLKNNLDEWIRLKIKEIMDEM